MADSVKPGDRIRITVNGSASFINMEGVALEHGPAPWILFDKPTMWPFIPDEFQNVPGAAQWRFDCRDMDDFEVIEPDVGTTPIDWVEDTPP